MRYEVDEKAFARVALLSRGERHAWIEQEVRNFQSVGDGATTRQVESFREYIADRLYDARAGVEPSVSSYLAHMTGER